MQKNKKKVNLTGIIMILAIVIVVLCVGVFALGHEENKDTDKSDAQSSVQVDVDGKLKTIEVNGKTYQQKSDIRTYVLMGIDHMDNENAQERGDFGQNDLNLVIVVNDTDQTYQILQINRDSMVDVTGIDSGGNDIGTTYEQISLAHSYGDGGEMSCENVVHTISSLLWDEKFEGYVAINMEAVNVLADDVGGVPVQVNDDFSEVDPSLVQGQTVTLTSANALTFVRTRKEIADGTNLNREKRQQEFMNSFIQQASKLSDEKLNEVYNSINELKTSNMTNSAVVNLMVKMKKYKELPLMTIDGTSKVNEKTNLNEYTLKNSSLQDTILTLFYNEKDD